MSGILDRVKALTRVEGHNNFSASEFRRALDGIAKLDSVGDWDRLQALQAVLSELLRFAPPSGFNALKGSKILAPNVSVETPLGLALRRFLE